MTAARSHNRHSDMRRQASTFIQTATGGSVKSRWFRAPQPNQPAKSMAWWAFLSASEAWNKYVRAMSEISMAASGHDWQCIVRFNVTLLRRKQSQRHVNEPWHVERRSPPTNWRRLEHGAWPNCSPSEVDPMAET